MINLTGKINQMKPMKKAERLEKWNAKGIENLEKFRQSKHQGKVNLYRKIMMLVREEDRTQFTNYQK